MQSKILVFPELTDVLLVKIQTVDKKHGLNYLFNKCKVFRVVKKRHIRRLGRSLTGYCDIQVI